MTDVIADAVAASLVAEADALRTVAQRMDVQALDEAVRRIAGASLVVTCASGSSGFAAAKFAHTLCCINRPAKFMPPAEAIHGGLGCVQQGTVVVMASRGGKTAELDPIIGVVLKKRAYLIALTENPQSRFAEAADLVLVTPQVKESDPLGLMATSSYVSAVAVFDAIIAGAIAHTGFTAGQFGLIHPGGAVGALLSEQAG